MTYVKANPGILCAEGKLSVRGGKMSIITTEALFRYDPRWSHQGDDSLQAAYFFAPPEFKFETWLPEQISK